MRQERVFLLLRNQGRERREERRKKRERESLEILRFLFSKGELGVSLD